MLDLLSKYSIGEILIFVIIFSLGIKQAIELKDWFKSKLKKNTDEIISEQERNKIIDEKLKQYDKTLLNLNNCIENFNKKLTILIDSDKDDIKAYIVEKHHYFCYAQKWIDDYSMDCLERRYAHYVEENGNSYVESLMEQLRALPRAPQ